MSFYTGGGIYTSKRSGAGGITRPDLTPPNFTMNFAAASSQYLTQTDANFGSYNRQKFGISCAVRVASLSNFRVIFSKYKSAVLSDQEFTLTITNTGAIGFTCQNSGGTVSIVTATAEIVAGSWYHIYATHDSTQAEAGDRLRLWKNGTEYSSFSTETQPTLNASVNTGTSSAAVGAWTAGNFPMDGSMHRLGFWSGTLPNITDLYSDGYTKPINGLSGLYAYLDVDGGDITSDGVLATAWTNNNSATSAPIPI